MNSNVPILRKNEVEKMKKAGSIAAELKRLLREKAQPGVKTKKLDQFAEEYILQQGARPAFKNYRGYPATLITCINDQVVHAIPGKYVLRKGDLLTVDLGAIWQGYNSDTATSFYVGEPNKETDFLKAGKEALKNALNQCRPGRRVGDISHAIQSTIEKAGCSVIRAFTGHGVGKSLHQPPEIPCYGWPDTGPKLAAGMGLAVEVMYTAGDYQVQILDDGWTTVTVDHSLAAQFEETVIITQGELTVTTAL